MDWIYLILIGILTGIIAGLFGVGGGAVIVPALVYLLGYSQLRATGTSLFVLLPPVGLAAVIQYYRSGNVDVRAGIYICIFLFFGAWLGAKLAHTLGNAALKIAFGVFLIFVGGLSISGGLKARAAERGAELKVEADKRL